MDVKVNYDFKLPDYTGEEEIFNSLTHFIGVIFAVCATIMMVSKAISNNSISLALTGLLYGFSMFAVYAVSSIYHGLDPIVNHTLKQKVRILDHCDIYLLIIGTYAPIALVKYRMYHPIMAWISFSILTAACIVGMIVTAKDFMRYKKLSYALYFIAGWSVLICIVQLIKVYSIPFMIYFVAGGAAYTLGMIFYAAQDHGHKYGHTIFHVFILLGSYLQFIPIYLYSI